MAAETLVGMKRPHSESTTEEQPRKKVKVRRRLHYVQEKPQNIEPAPQDPVFVQGQLLRSISAALAMVGFDSVKPTALEMFRACVEEYMMNFLHYTRTSMHTSRRTTPTAVDFASALALTPNTSRASLLTPQLDLPIPEDISYPPIPSPDPPPSVTQDFSAFLQEPPAESQDATLRPYIPPYFPQLPPKHSWEYTPVYAERERDARKIREKATEEGIQAEQALRKLAAAAKSGAVKVETEKRALIGPGRKVERRDRIRRGKTPEDAEEMFAEMMGQVVGGRDRDEEDAMDLGVEGRRELGEEGVDVGMPEGVVVNWDMGGWRQGRRKRLRL